METNPPASAAQLIADITTEIKNYYAAIKSDKTFSEVKAIRIKINELYAQLKTLHPEENFQLNKELL
jgi:hypothetical protein